MNNVIFMLVDSVFSEAISNNRTEESSSPFIDSLVKEGLFADNVYSYAPYTDAATIGLYCGIPTLEKLGYYYGINIAEYNHFRLFEEQGYDTYGLYYPYYLVSSKTKKSVKNVIYTGGFKYSSVWYGKLEYYADIITHRELTEVEYKLVEKCIDMVFDCWKTFYHDISCDKNASIIIKKLKTDDMRAEGEKGLLQEIEKYRISKRTYINQLLVQGMNHRLASINDFDFGKKEDKVFLKQVYKENKTILSEIQRMNFRRNIFNNFPSIKKTYKEFKNLIINKNTKSMRYFGNYAMLLAGSNLMKNRSLGKRDWQEVASLNSQIEALFTALEKRNTDKPFYASLHVLEPHHNVSFFSFDSFDHNLVKGEFDYLEPLVNHCGKKFSGNLLYQLSIRYVDLCVKRLFEKLSDKKMLDNTTIVLVADHGTSYTFDPLRTHVVNTFHKENYNIPLLIWEKNMPDQERGKFTNFYSSEDVLPTLCKVVGLKIPEEYKGKVIFEEKTGRPYIITEYMGPGVPDMISRDVWISIRNRNYVIAYKNNISHDLNKDYPDLIYDLKNDQWELENCNKNYKLLMSYEVQFLIEKLSQRYQNIKDNTEKILTKLDCIEL